MEAVPKLPLLSFELKNSPENAHFGPKLKQYIAEAYREDPDSYNNEIHQLEGLRSTAVRPSIDSTGLNALNRYFCQLRSLVSRFPMAKGQPAAVSFAWKLNSNMTCTVPDIRFEMACILYNIGALHTQLGASEPRTSGDSMKAACTHYQNAAWAFTYLRENYTQSLGNAIAGDMMVLLQEICFAQAQECILEKSIQDTRKSSVIGAVATQVYLFYKNSLALLGPSTGADDIHESIGTKLYNYWYHYLSFKMAYIGCIVCLYQGMHAEEQQKMGERVAFYQLAADKLAEARKLMKYIEPVQITQEALTFTNDVVEGKRKAAKNENEFIYHEEVPDKDLLQDLKPVCLVKALPINFNDPAISGPDIFAKLVPMGAHEAASVYSEEKAKLLRQVVSQAEAKNSELAEFMSSLQLDQLEVIDSDQKIPQEIVDRCAAMNAKTDVIQALVDSMNNLAEIISDVEHCLADIKSLIQEETQKEKDFQKVMGPRPPSIVQTELSREFHKYQEAHSRTNESNQVLHKAMTLHIANLKLLSQPVDVLQAKIPSIENIEGLDRETMMEMKRVVGKAREMQTQRDTLVQQLRDSINNDDITSILLARSSDPREDIFKEELEKHIPKVKIIEQNLSAQENIINKLTSLYAQYGDSRRLLSDVLRKRDGLINALITSYDTYEELLGKSQKGLEFYKKMYSNVNQLLSRLKSTCQVQEEERAQQLAKQSSKGAAALAAETAAGAAAGLRGAEGGAIPHTPAPAPGASLKLKDYLPYMKGRNMGRQAAPQAYADPVISEAYYPESIYPTSVRPTPVGSEATDMTQMKLTDGAVPGVSGLSPYHRMGQYAPSEADMYYGYPTAKPMEKPNDFGYTPYTPQLSSQGIAVEPQYSNPYYAGSQNNTTLVTDSQNVSYSGSNSNLSHSQYNVNVNNNPYSTNAYQMGTIPEAASSMTLYNAANQPMMNQQTDLNVNFGQMQIAPKPEPNVPGYSEYSSQNYYNQYPQSSTTPMATYSHAPQNSATSLTPSQVPSDYSNTYPYAVETPNQYSQPGIPQVSTPYSVPNQTVTPSYPDQTVNPVSSAYSISNPHISYVTINQDVSQGYTVYTNAESAATSTTNVFSEPQVTVANVPSPYHFEQDPKYDPATLAQLDALDEPIKSHVTGEALSSPMNYQNYQNYQNITKPEQVVQGPQYNPTEQSQFPSQNYQANYVFVEPTSFANFATPQSSQNHPGYTYNPASGNYDYNYGSQNSSSQVRDSSHMTQEQNWAPQGVYTSAGSHQTVQSPSENIPPLQPPNENSNSQLYYNSPYGYMTTTNQSTEMPPISTPNATNYGANVNQATYMQSGEQNTNVTFTNNQNQVTTPVENVNEPPNFEQQKTGYVTRNSGNMNAVPSNIEQNTGSVDQNSVNISSQSTAPPTEPKEEPQEIKSEPVETKEPSAFDLLSDIDFTVETPPLKPEIKVPQISESAIIKRSINLPKEEPVPKPVIKEEVIERPAKRDLFSDPGLVNKFTVEVKNLQKLVDSLVKKVGGLTVLDAKWKTFQDAQSKDNMTRSKHMARKHSSGNIVTHVVPYDDSRLTLKSDPDAYINASYCKQLASWCIPLAISKNPSDKQYGIFWKAVLENKMTCVVCLLSEIEMQGKTYWPTAKGQTLELEGVKVTLDEVTCTVHWTERKLTVASGKAVLSVMHYQINVFPVKIVCSPLVLLADKVLSQTYENRLSNQLTGALVQCELGAGRSALVALLIMVMCQVRAGQLDLCDMLDAGCTNLCKQRANVLEDTKYLADAYRTALFYVQGVLCSGTTQFNGEAVSVPMGASLPPPPSSLPAAATAPSANQKAQKFSRESFEEMKQSPGLTSGDMKDPLNFLDPLWSLKKK